MKKSYVSEADGYLNQEDFIDWGEEEKYLKQIGIGECAGVVIDLIATLFLVLR